MPQPKLINRLAQVLLPQPMAFCGTPMVITAPPKETGGLDRLVYWINGRNCQGKQLPHDDRNIGKMCVARHLTLEDFFRLIEKQYKSFVEKLESNYACYPTIQLLVAST